MTDKDFAKIGYRAFYKERKRQDRSLILPTWNESNQEPWIAFAKAVRIAVYEMLYKNT